MIFVEDQSTADHNDMNDQKANKATKKASASGNMDVLEDKKDKSESRLSDEQAFDKSKQSPKDQMAAALPRFVSEWQWMNADPKMHACEYDEGFV